MRALVKHALAVAAVLLLFQAAPALALPTLSVQPPTITVDAGQSFTLDVDIAGVLDLYAFQFDVAFDPSLLAGIDTSEGSFLPAGGATGFIRGDTTVPGAITFTADTLTGFIPGVSGNGTLATIDFSALASGVTSIDLSNIILLDSNLANIDVTSAAGQVTIQPAPVSVPTPATALLVMVGAAAASISTLVRRRKAPRPAWR